MVDSTGKKLDDTQEQELRLALRAILQTLEGRKYLWHLMGLCGTFKQPFGGDVNRTIFNCGQQNIGQVILGEVLAVSPEAYQRMLQENQNG